MLPLFSYRLNNLANAVFLIVLASLLIEKKFIIKLDSPLYVFFGIIIWYAFLSSFWSINSNASLNSSFVILKNFGLAFCVYNIIDTRVKINRIIISLLIGVYILIIYTISFYGWNGFIQFLKSGERLGGDITQENLLGTYSAIAAAISIYKAYWDKKKIYILLAIPGFIFIFASGSRTALLIVSSAIIATTYFNNRSKRLLKSILVIISTIIVFNVIKSLDWFPTAFARFDEFLVIFNDINQTDRSTQARVRFIEYGIRFFLNKPLFGYGTNQFNFLFEAAYGRGMSPHNTYIQVLVSYGLIGFCTWFGMYIYLFKNVLKTNEKDIGTFVAALLFMWLISDWFHHSMTDKLTYVLLATGFAYVGMIKNDRKVND
jgi:O-antigen ligase